ncbi:hypothetical protein SCARR_02040 [Pontiella sulfatireligans]|uniref:Uncharacterized protein n=2 Tax=Pontiella sulfatireligans TaxID=2750658 RepID=A0A6C2UIF9_9BACT|nr:hypothetical protein SCARR_02040 [Pontiella sulfatireligans]
MAGALALAVGCSDVPQAGSARPQAEVLPADLRLLQGNWHCVDRECKAYFEGYKMQLSYGSPSAPYVHKRNACIQSVDMELSRMKLYHDDRPLFYEVGRGRGAKWLELRFYNDYDRVWEQVRLVRPGVASNGSEKLANL